MLELFKLWLELCDWMDTWAVKGVVLLQGDQGGPRGTRGDWGDLLSAETESPIYRQSRDGTQPQQLIEINSDMHLDIIKGLIRVFIFKRWIDPRMNGLKQFLQFIFSKTERWLNWTNWPPHRCGLWCRKCIGLGTISWHGETEQRSQSVLQQRTLYMSSINDDRGFSC